MSQSRLRFQITRAFNPLTQYICPPNLPLSPVPSSSTGSFDSLTDQRRKRVPYYSQSFCCQQHPESRVHERLSLPKWLLWLPSSLDKTIFDRRSEHFHIQMTWRHAGLLPTSIRSSFRSPPEMSRLITCWIMAWRYSSWYWSWYLDDSTVDALGSEHESSYKDFEIDKPRKKKAKW